MIKSLRGALVPFLALAVLAATFAAAPAAAQPFIGQPTWQADPTAVCTYVGRSGCPSVVADEPSPYGATVEIAGSGVVTAATATATVPKAALKTTYLSGLRITGGGATGASIITCTIVGLLGGTISIAVPIVAGATTGIAAIAQEFNPPIPSSAVNVDIVVSCPTFGVGNTAASIVAWGYIR